MSDFPDISIGMLLFPGLTSLDLTGPYEVFAFAPGAKVHLIWKTLDPVISDRGLAMLPTQTFESCPPLDVICIPGGPGQINLMDDDSTLAFIRHQSQQARLVTSVCTGSLILGRQGCFRDIKPRLTGHRPTSLLFWAQNLSVSGWFGMVIVLPVRA